MRWKSKTGRQAHAKKTARRRVGDAIKRDVALKHPFSALRFFLRFYWIMLRLLL